VEELLRQRVGALALGYEDLMRRQLIFTRAAYAANVAILFSLCEFFGLGHATHSDISYRKSRT
jgi:hypothetical protein